MMLHVVNWRTSFLFYPLTKSTPAVRRFRCKTKVVTYFVVDVERFVRSHLRLISLLCYTVLKTKVCDLFCYVTRFVRPNVVIRFR